MNTKDFLKEVAYQDDMEICEGTLSRSWKSKFDDSYIAHVGQESSVKPLADREITKELTHGVGFSPKDGKWYGWSHRAIYGFMIGSTCNKGDCHYRASNEDDEIAAAILFWSSENHVNVRAEKVKDGEIYVSWEYDKKTPNEKLRQTISGCTWQYDVKFGRGEWTAKTLADAKQMAIDFNEGVS